MHLQSHVLHGPFTHSCRRCPAGQALYSKQPLGTQPTGARAPGIRWLRRLAALAQHLGQLLVATPGEAPAWPHGDLLPVVERREPAAQPEGSALGALVLTRGLRKESTGVGGCRPSVFPLSGNSGGPGNSHAQPGHTWVTFAGPWSLSLVII